MTLDFIKLFVGMGLAFLIILTAEFCDAATYYVRTDGGTATQCTGTTDAAYSGTGTNQPCAFNHPFWANSPIGNNPTKMVGGDTLIIDGSNSSQYMMGFGAPNSNDTTTCYPNWAYSCYMRSIPSGPDAVHPTRILGKGWDSGCVNPPQLWATESASMIINLANSSNVEVQCLEITDHSDCQEHGPKACQRDTPPFGTWGESGLKASDSTNVLLRNINIHGMAYRGVHAGRLKDWTIEDSKLVANSFVGWDGDIGANVSSNSGTMTFTRAQIEYSGCGETYPGNLPYNCYSQDQGGYGDGLGTHKTGANWVFNNCDISHNVSDGLDLLYHDGNGTVTIKRSRFEGNAGNQVKSATDTVIENSLIVGNCSYFSGNPITWQSSTFNNCRAGGGSIALSFHQGMNVNIKNSTITGNGDVIVMSAGSSCNGTEVLNSRNNIFLGGTNYFYEAESSGLYYAAGQYGNGEGSCGTLPLSDDYSIIWNTVHLSTDCSGPHSQCKDPQFVGPIVKYYTGNAYNLNLQSSSPAKDGALVLAGASSLDYNEYDRGAAWDTGAIEIGSVPVPEATPTTPSPTTTTPVCGNGIVEGTEVCDDGNLISGDSCSSTCQVETIIVPVCGNGKLEGTETCDDGNLISGDGCSSTCQVETVSAPEPTITPVCGNGKVEGTEQCDDGNRKNGDACSNSCKLRVSGKRR